MKPDTVFIGNNKASFNSNDVKGELVTIEKENYYKISNSDTMRPFFMSIVSDSNHWMFISSNGGLSAGRKNSESSLFPYYTDDKITESFDLTGSKTILQIQSKRKNPIMGTFFRQVQRNLYNTKKPI